MGHQRIVLRGLSPQALQGKQWETESILRIGRLDTQEVVLHDESISRRHAEVVATAEGWNVHDLGSTNGTFLNGVRVGRADRKLQRDDLLQCGILAMAVAQLEEGNPFVLRQQEMLINTLTALGQAVEMRDHYTGGHTQRVASLASALARELDLSFEERYQLRVGTPLHDVGKIGIDDAVLRKPGRLTAAEFEHMKLHTLKGVAILEAIPELAPMLPIVRSHHERWDGKGYPDGLAGDKISLLARIVAVADAFDAMSSDRPYRHGMTLDEAFHELAAKAGTHFDPRCATAFRRLQPCVERLYAEEQSFQNLSDATPPTLSLKNLQHALLQGHPHEEVEQPPSSTFQKFATKEMVS